MYKILISFLKKHPALFLSGGYFVITSIGIIYNYFFYNEFGVKILNFSDLSDFLLVSIVTPRTLGIFIVAIILVVILSILDSFLRSKFKGYKSSSRYLKPKYTDPLMHVLIIFILVTIYTQKLAISNAAAIKSGNFDEYVVQVLNDEHSATEKSYALLGASTRYIYLFDLNKFETLIIPVVNIKKMNKKVNDTKHNGEKVIIQEDIEKKKGVNEK